MKKVDPIVTVIVPVYKVEKYLQQCIESIINQTLKEIEIILADEGDMDACRFVIDHYVQNDSRVIALHDKHGGYGASVNHGFDVARGEYIGIIESDDFIEPDMYEELYNYAKKLDADVVKCGFYELFGTTRTESWINVTTSDNVPNNSLYDAAEYPIQFSFHPAIWAGIYRTEYIHKNNIQFVKTGPYVDHGFRFDSFLNTKKTAWINKSFYNYRIDNPSSTANNYNMRAMIRRFYEAHEMFDKKFGIAAYTKIGMYYIMEVYRLTLEKIVFLRYEDDDMDSLFKLIHDYLQLTSEKIILKSPILETHQKIITLLARNTVSYDDFLVKMRNKRLLFFKLWIFKKSHGFLYCWEQNGLWYTFKLFCKKCLNKIKRIRY